MSIQITFLGTASGLPAPDRFGQTIVVTNHQTERPQHYILDTGDGASSLFMHHGFDHNDIAAIFISHMHGDHHGGLTQVLKTCMHVHRKEPITILAPGEGIPVIQHYLEGSYLFPSLLGFPINWVSLAELGNNAATLSQNTSLTAYSNQHLAWVGQHLARHKVHTSVQHTMESYSAVLQVGSTRLVYSGNLNGPQGSDELAPYVAPCDLLIAELAHVDPYELGRFLAGRQISHTVVTHYHPKWNGVSDADITAKVLAGAGSTGLIGQLTLAHDGTEIRLH